MRPAFFLDLTHFFKKYVNAIEHFEPHSLVSVVADDALELLVGCECGRS
jgi:hypothetical protein